MIDPSISLGIRPQQVDTPTDALARTTSIANVVSQMQQRQRLAADEEAQAQIRTAQATQAQKQISDQNVLDQVSKSHLSYDSDAGDINYDDNGIASDLHKIGRDDLLPKFQQQRDAMKTEHRQQSLAQIGAAQKMTDAIGVPADNFLALPQEEKPAQYQSLLQSMAAAVPGSTKQLPQEYGPDAETKLKELSDHRKQIQDVATQLNEASNREALSRLNDDQLTPQQRWDKYNQGAGPMPQWYANAITAKKSGISPPAANTYQVRRITAGNGIDVSGVPDDAVDQAGNTILPEARTPGSRWQAFQQGSQVYYAPAGVNRSAAQEKEDRTQAGYAFTIGKNVADLTPKDKIDADAWYAKQTPQKLTEFDKRYALYQKDPNTYAALFGHGGPKGDTPLTQQAKATILNRIDVGIAKQGLQGNDAAAYRNQQLQELKDAGIDMTPAAASRPVAAPAKPAAAQPAAKPATTATPPKGAPSHGATYGPTMTRTLKSGGTVTVRQNLATKQWEEVPQ